TATTADFAWTGEDGARYVCQVDGEFRPDCTSLHLTGLAVGEHTVKIIQIDSHSNGGEWLTLTWAVRAPDVAAPVQPAPTPTPTATPTPTPEPPAPTFTATVGETPASAATTTVAVAQKGVDVGCKMTGVELKSCVVQLYAQTHGASIARRVLVGTGRVS